MRNIFLTFILTVALAGQAAALEWEFLQSNNISRINEVHASAVATPVAFPPNAVYRKWDRIKAQQQTKEFLSEFKLIDTSPVLVLASPTRTETLFGRRFVVVDDRPVTAQNQR